MGIGYKHVAFIPHTLGGSSLTTDDPLLQSAIEQHRLFGSFITVEVVRENKAKASQSPTGSGDAKADAPEEVTVNTFSDAKDYVANRWGVSRTQFHNSEEVIRFAAEHGVIIKTR